MKSTPKLLAIVTICSVMALASNAQEEDQTFPFYTKIDIGGNQTQNADLHQFFGAPVASGKVKFEPGVRAGFSAGWQACNWFAAELEVGFTENGIDSLSGVPDQVRIDDASFMQVPVLFNAKLQYKNSTHITPYVGAGAGFATDIFDAQYIHLGNAVIHGNDADVVFAWQVFAGVKYDFNPNMGVGLEYRLLFADGANWHADFEGGGTGNDLVSFGSTMNHSISLVVDFKF